MLITKMQTPEARFYWGYSGGEGAKMKRFLGIILIIAMMIPTAACSESNKKETEETPPEIEVYIGNDAIQQSRSTEEQSYENWCKSFLDAFRIDFANTFNADEIGKDVFLCKILLCGFTLFFSDVFA